MDDVLDSLIEIKLAEKDDFLKVKETLERIGVASNRTQTLYQSCHILHKKGRYYITHFKEMFKLDGKPSSMTKEDIARRNTIASLLEEWGLIEIVNPDVLNDNYISLTKLKIIPYKEKQKWTLVTKYSIGK